MRAINPIGFVIEKARAAWRWLLRGTVVIILIYSRDELAR